eukprot:gene4921-6003_t
MELSADLADALNNLGAALHQLANVSLESIASIDPCISGVVGGAHDLAVAEHYKHVAEACAQLHVDAEKLNPRWNRTYGRNGTFWTGALKDGRHRGGIPYFCPTGWTRFSLNVCADHEFDQRYDHWGYVYHGTKSKHVGSILTSGIRGSATGMCYCGKDESAVYTSPSIEYAGHPRYARVDINPETRKWVQVVLQCRVDPHAIWKKKSETMGATAAGITIDPNIGNETMEWLIKPNYTDPATGNRYIRDAIVCTGIMLRLTDEHPHNCPAYWWSRDPEYLSSWCMSHHLPKTAPDQERGRKARRSWEVCENTSLTAGFTCSGDPLNDHFEAVPKYVNIDIGKTHMSNQPFAQGGMRHAYYLYAPGVAAVYYDHDSVASSKGFVPSPWFVVKPYRQETLAHIENALHITADQAVDREIRTYKAASYFAALFNKKVAASGMLPRGCGIQFLEPLVFNFNGEVFFGEQFIEGNDFVKWNDNAGVLNLSLDATRQRINEIVAAFSHFTYARSKGTLMVVDVQGWYRPGNTTCHVRDESTSFIFTDPQ